MAQIDELRLTVRVARMYYEWNIKQTAIARQLGLSQPTVSRLLQQAKDQGIIRISVNVPQGIYTDLEEELVRLYRLRDAIVVDCSGESDERFIERQIGAAAAYYLESALRPNEVVGISSWSSTLLALVDAMHPAPRKGDVRVVQILGGVGSPSAEAHAGRLTSRLTDLLGGQAIFLPAPGIVGSAAVRDAITADHFVRDAMALFEPGRWRVSDPAEADSAAANGEQPHHLGAFHRSEVAHTVKHFEHGPPAADRLVVSPLFQNEDVPSLAGQFTSDRGTARAATDHDGLSPQTGLCLRTGVSSSAQRPFLRFPLHRSSLGLFPFARPACTDHPQEPGRGSGLRATPRTGPPPPKIPDSRGPAIPDCFS